LRSLMRVGQWEAVTYPTKTVFLNSLTFLLAGAYLVIVGILAKIMVWLGGDSSFQLKAFFILVSVAGAAVIAVSDRARVHLRRWISYYLQKPLYDYRAVWRSFTEGLASQVNEEELCGAAIKLVARIFELLSVSVWLIDERKENFVCAASTSVSKSAALDVQPSRQEAADIIKQFQTHHEPVKFEREKAAWAEALRKCHPAQFSKGGDRVCVPLEAGGSLIGVMLLGDRVAGLNFSFQDFDLLHCVGEQMAACLLNARLSQRLLQNKEMEAFQAMSTFFVHDLKNLASTLNLMLKNLPVHFDNPEFRADALRGIGKTCDHINHLISRLSLLRESLQIRAIETDLNKVVATSLANCPPTPGVEIKQQFPALPKVMLDAEQIDKVITNLALNAIEAVPQGGSISVQTSQNNGWAVVTVADTGCGMDVDFMTNSLFRPFQTTKKKGLGIGMFQSKMIVEAHGGRIEVESKRGKGSTFRVLLPLPTSAT
jgi:putative PEP-CTERM system histidine kinase